MKFLIIILLNLSIFSTIFAQELSNDLKQLSTRSFTKKATIVKKLVQDYHDNDNLPKALTAMLNGDLYYTKEEKKFVVIKKKEGTTYLAQEIFDEKQTLFYSKYALKKVKTNNKLRSIIRSQLAQMNLFSKKSEIRLKSAQNILKHIDEDSKTLVQRALQDEKNNEVKKLLIEIDTIIQAKSSDKELQKKAVKNLGDYLSVQALQTLKEISQGTSDKDVQALAKKSIDSIKRSRSFYGFVEQAFFGLSLGSVLLLAAIGLAITFGVMKVINMAHGEMMMIGAYTTFSIQQIFPNLIEYSVLIAIPAAFIVSGIFGILIERLVIRHLYGRPLETLLATFGISLILQQLVRSVFSPLNQEVKTPSWMSGSLHVNSALSLTYNRLYIAIFAFLVFAGVLLILKKTSLGLKLRAVTQNRQMAQAMGIKTGFIDAMTFGIGSGIAGIAGVALSQLTNVGPNLGQAYIVDSFMVVVFGGVGNLWGTLIGALSLGEINKFMEPYAGAVLAKVIILVFIILFIQKRPRGLFPQKGRDAQD
jgi:urea transport system permease protein